MFKNPEPRKTMTSNSPKPQPSSSRNKMLGIVAAGLAVAVTGVYAMLGSNGNEQVSQKAVEVAAPVSTGSATSELDKSLSTGAMAAFVFKKDRPEVVTGEFKDADGKTVDMSNWTGRVALVNLWATWCGPCRAEMPHLAKLQELYGSDQFEVVALSVDLKGAEASSAFLKDIKADNLALYVDQTAKAMNKLGAYGLPLTVLVDRQGREIGRLLGPADWAGEEAKRLIEAAIAENPQS
jgi:thiol-disulfide isomerase/thioredoxin